MPEANYQSLYSFSPDPPKHAPVIKVSCGIGDTDGFPAFDVDSDAYASKEDSKWGFLITGGAEFHMALTVFQVTPDGLADKNGIRLGDIILEINEEDATQLTLAQALEKIDASGKKVLFLVKSMDDEDQYDGNEPGEEKSIVMRVPKPMPPPKVSIEQRLREMQRKLSEIAEIPKILSSTLTTVSQTFDKLMPTDAVQLKQLVQRRKYSYDEDAIDYELSDNDIEGDDDDDNDDDDADAVKQCRKYAKVKEITPESDYASEANYPESEEDINAAEDDEADDDYDDSDYEAYCVENNDSTAIDGNDDEEDFLTTSYTWNIRNIPKLKVNDEQNIEVNQEIDDFKKSRDLQDKHEKLDKFERSWPWADREKIIYKQSTCHLVPRKPLGLVEKRIQLLAKQHLVDHLEQMEKK